MDWMASEGSLQEAGSMGAQVRRKSLAAWIENAKVQYEVLSHHEDPVMAGNPAAAANRCARRLQTGNIQALHGSKYKVCFGRGRF